MLVYIDRINVMSAVVLVMNQAGCCRVLECFSSILWSCSRFVLFVQAAMNHHALPVHNGGSLLAEHELVNLEQYLCSPCFVPGLGVLQIWSMSSGPVDTVAGVMLHDHTGMG